MISEPPVGSVVRSTSGEIWMRYPDHPDCDRWYQLSDVWGGEPWSFLEGSTVLYHPDQDMVLVPRQALANIMAPKPPRLTSAQSSAYFHALMTVRKALDGAL